MINQAFIEQRIITTRHNQKDIGKEIYICDDFDSGSIDLVEYCDSFYDDDMELLEMVLNSVFNVESPIKGEHNIRNILNNVKNNKRGIYIEGTFYDWEDLKPVFEKAGY